MEKNLTESILLVCSAFNKHKVEYLVVGGVAVALHGYFRRSLNIQGAESEKPDLDFWYNATYSNYFLVLNTLEELGQNVSEFRAEQSPNPKKSFFKYEFETFTLDLLPHLKAGLSFRQSFQKKETVTFGGVLIPFLNFDDLIIDKTANSRPKDITDIEYLKLKRRENG